MGLCAGINDFPFVTGADIKAALPTLKAAGVPYYVHSELALDMGAEAPVCWVSSLHVPATVQPCVGLHPHQPGYWYAFCYMLPADVCGLWTLQVLLVKLFTFCSLGSLDSNSIAQPQVDCRCMMFL